MRIRVLALLVALLLAGCATVDKSQLFDGATTWYAFSQGFSEANPVLSGLNGPEIIAAKLLVTQAVKLTPDAFCVPATQSLTVTGFGAGIWNLAVVANAWWASIPVIAIIVWTYWNPWWEDSKAVCADPFDWLPEINISEQQYSWGDK